MSVYDNDHLDQQIKNLKKQLKSQQQTEKRYQKQMTSQATLHQKAVHGKANPLDDSLDSGPNKARSALARKYRLKYEDTIDPTKDGLKELNAMIGLSSVKDLIRHYIADAEITKRAQDLGQKSQMSSLNMIFMGNPGTGKTAVARLVGKILFQKHIIKKPLFKECSARDLMSTLVGGALLKTHRLMREAEGGVLFIDEAYILAPNENQDDAANDTKKDAVSELLRMAENNRQDTVVILAGYKDKMENLMNRANEGLRSRFNHKINFPDYSNDEMYQIFLYHAKRDFCKLGKTERLALKKNLPNFIKTSKAHHANSNARLMRNLLHMVMSCHKFDLAQHYDIQKLTLEQINDINESDLKHGFARTLKNE